jgi:hypothetical protein
MNLRTFKHQLRRGVGSAILAIEQAEDRAQYRDAVLWCCLHDSAYDGQCEGTKGAYLYAAIVALGAKDAFLKPLSEKYLTRCEGGLFSQLGDILYGYAKDGSALAKAALYRKYENFAARSWHVTHRDGYQWDEVAYSLINLDGFSLFKRYFGDVGAVLQKNPDIRRRVSIFDDWFLRRMRRKFGKRLDTFFSKMSAKSLPLKSLADELKAEESCQQALPSHNVAISLEDILSAAQEKGANSQHFGYTLRFANQASTEELQTLAEHVFKADDLNVKAYLLLAFRRKPFPLDIAPLLAYVNLGNDHLKEACIDVLEIIQDVRIHELAISLLSSGELYALSLLTENYRLSDDAVIRAAVTKSSQIEHHVQVDIASIYSRHRSQDALATLLHVYRNGNCAFCRCSIVEALHHCRVLSDQILAECLHDSYEDTRKFARRIARGRVSAAIFDFSDCQPTVR